MYIGPSLFTFRWCFAVSSSLITLHHNAPCSSRTCLECALVSSEACGMSNVALWPWMI